MPEVTSTDLISLANCLPEHFEPRIGQQFVFAGDTGVEVTLELLEVNVKPRRGHTRVPFALLFALRGQPGTPPLGLLYPRFEGFVPGEGWFINRVTVLGESPGEAFCEAVFA